jgi:SAM-dependent methyltransferase
MGLSIESIRFLLEARRQGARFDRVLTLGRQHVAVATERLRDFLAADSLWPPAQGERLFDELAAQPERRFEAFAHALGARRVESCDASPYEGATRIHDLNQPVPAAWHEQFSVIIDGGTLEHVFNFPVALANCMRMVEVGGHLILLTPANNFFGHGFYQFSPELFYRALSPAQGFRVERMEAVADADGTSKLFGVPYSFPIVGPRYAVTDPEAIRSRVTLLNDRAVLLYVQARKTAAVQPFATIPQQSDYVSQWESSAAPSPGPASATAPTASAAASSSTATSTSAAASAPAGGGGAQGGVGAWLQRHLSERFCRETLPRLAWWVDPLRRIRFRRAHSFHNRRFFRRVGSSGGG